MTKSRKASQERYPNHISLMLRLLDGSKRYFILSILFAWLTSLLDLINPRIISFTVDSIIGTASASTVSLFAWLAARVGGMENLKDHIGLVAALVILIAVAAGTARYLFRMMNAKGQEVMLESTRNLLYRHITSLPLSWHNKNHTGDIIQRCTSDVEVVRSFLSEQLITFIRMMAQILLALIFMASISGKLTLIVLIFIPITVGFSYFFHKRIQASFMKVDEVEGQLSAVAQENLTGVRVVRAFGRESYERERFEKKNESYTGLWDHLMKLLSLFWAASDGIAGTETLVVMILGAVLCLNSQITVGGYIAFLTYSAMLSGPVRQLGRVISGMSRAGVSIDRIRYILNSEPEKETEPASARTLSGDIVFDHVTFRYGTEESPVLDDVSLTCESGKVTGILGSTGSGKSTLMYLLCRLYDLENGSGEIRIGENKLPSISRQSIREQVGIVLQEPFLFSRTLGENISITNPTASMEDIISAAKAAVLDETVDRFSKGYDTFVGERGVSLSGGQKQRAAIAQTYLRQTPILILDDSLSAVDSQTDARIRHEMDKASGATRILISHRITTLMHADKIIVLDKGRVVESGTHEELMQANGFYRRICDLQSPENVA